MRWGVVSAARTRRCRGELYARENVLVLPGSYLSREFEGVNPGRNRARLALVAPLAECTEATQRIRNYVESLS